MKLRQSIIRILLGAFCLSLFSLAACADAPPVISSVTAEAGTVRGGDEVRVSCQATDPEGGALEYIWTASAGDIVSQSPFAEWTAPDEAGPYEIRVSVRDGKGNETKDAVIVYVAANLPPRIDSLLADPSPVGEGQQCFLKCGAEDPEGDTITYNWETEEGTLSGAGPVVSWTTPYDVNSSVIKVTVTDIQGQSATMTVNVSIVPNHDPKIDMLTATPRSMTPGVESILQCVAVDIDGDPLEYSWTVDGGTLHGSGSDVTWTAPEECGTYIVTVTVTDGRHGKAVQEQVLRVAKSGG